MKHLDRPCGYFKGWVLASFWLEPQISFQLIRTMEFILTFAVAFLLLTVTMATVDLEFRCNQGNYVIKNPDTARYTGVNGYYANGTACESNVEGTMSEILTVSDCGMVITFLLFSYKLI